MTTPPKTIHLHDYQVPDFLIDKTELHVDLDETHTRVTSHLTIKRNPLAQSLSRHASVIRRRVNAFIRQY